MLGVSAVTWEAIASASDLGVDPRGTAVLFDNPDVGGDSFLNWRCVGPTDNENNENNENNVTVLLMHGYGGYAAQFMFGAASAFTAASHPPSVSPAQAPAGTCLH